MRTLLSVHIRSTPNLGDRVCAPLDYVSIADTIVQPVDIADYTGGDAVIGGGGLLHPGLDATLERHSMKNSKRVIWGIGTNYHDVTDAVHPSWLLAYDLVGLRDINAAKTAGIDYVACPSCLSPEFDKARPEPTEDVVLYEHYDRRLPYLALNYRPRGRTNSIDDVSLAECLDFLASGKVVITNSYHGVYWTLLLGRKAAIYEPWSSRFYHLGVDVPVLHGDAADWRQKTEAFTPPSDYLAKCRASNYAFLEKVRALFASEKEQMEHFAI